MSNGSIIFYCKRCMGKDRSGEVHFWSTRVGEESFLLICELRKSDSSLLQFKWEILISVFKKCLLPCLLRVEGV